MPASWPLRAGQKDNATLGRIGLAFVLGLGLSAFYWIPALAELRYTHAETMMLQGVNDVTNGLVAAARLVQDGWTTIYSGDNHFRYGLLMFVYGIIGVVSILGKIAGCGWWLPYWQGPGW